MKAGRSVGDCRQDWASSEAGGRGAWLREGDRGRLREVSPAPAPRSRVSYADEFPESILRGGSRRLGASGLSRSGSLHSINNPAPVHEPRPSGGASSAVSPTLQSVLGRMEAEQNAAKQLQWFEKKNANCMEILIFYY